MGAWACRAPTFRRSTRRRCAHSWGGRGGARHTWIKWALASSASRFSALRRGPVARHRGTNGQHGKIKRKTEKGHARACVLYPPHLWPTNSPRPARWPASGPDAHRRRTGRELADAGDEAQPLHPVKTQQQCQMGRSAACEVWGDTSGCGRLWGCQRRRRAEPCVAMGPAREGVSPRLTRVLPPNVQGARPLLCPRGPSPPRGGGNKRPGLGRDSSLGRVHQLRRVAMSTGEPRPRHSAIARPPTVSVAWPRLFERKKRARDATFTKPIGGRVPLRASAASPNG